VRYLRETEMVVEIMNDSRWKSRIEVVKRMTESWDESSLERRTEVIRNMRRIGSLGRRLEVKL